MSFWLSVALASWGSVEPSPTIDFFEGNVRDAKVRALDQDKWIFIELYASWCTSCRLMEETTFRAVPVIDRLNSDFVPVRLDIDDPEGKLFAAEYNVTTLPAMIVTDPGGLPIIQVEKAVGEEELVQLLEKCRKAKQGLKK